MTQQAAARVLPEAAPKPALGVREQVDSISNVVAADQAYLSDAIGSVSRQRRGLLQRLTPRSAADRREAVVTARQPSAKTMPDASLRQAIRDGVARASAVIGLAGIALIHVLDAPGHFAGPASYIGWMYVALIIGCLGVAGALIRNSDGRAWTAAALVAVGPIVAFLLSRTVGLPASSDDIGNWAEPLGMASLFVEGSVVALSAAVVLERVGAFAGALAPQAAQFRHAVRA
jgi:hypothetical protein